jgi:glucosamine--fructose-6-phosphate aminotransferase (isomerizing)
VCGIIGYIGHEQALPILIQGLHRLEYRGYDSAGVALLEDGNLCRVRGQGKVEGLASKLSQGQFTSTLAWAILGGRRMGNRLKRMPIPTSVWTDQL